jgi:hypothetical protein
VDEEESVDGDLRPELNADELEQALAQTRRSLNDVPDEHRSRREAAIDQFSHYAALLRTASSIGGDMPRPSRFYWFKLVFPDGRWNVEEKLLQSSPAVGDVVDLAEYGQWQIRTSQFVKPRPSQKPAQEFFVCAPAA